MNRFRGIGPLMATVSALAGITTSAWGQTSPATPDFLEEIVVTARMRTESLQQVPVSVTAFTEKEIERAGIERPADFIALTPNITVAESQSAGITFITVRGISQVRNGESPVAVVVDGVLQTSSLQFNQELFDIQQIEVMKGPQGALYGRNAIGGAISITTVQPGNDAEGKISIGTGNGGQVKAQIGVRGPIVEDKLFASLSASHKSRDGYLTNVFRQEKADPYNSQGGRGRLILQASDTLKADLRISYDNTKAGAVNFVRNNRFANGQYSFGAAGSLPGDANDVGPNLESNVRGIGRRQLFNASLKLDWDFDIGTLTSVSAYDWTREWTRADGSPYSRAIGSTQSSLFDVDAKSQEIRFTSPGSDRFRYILGAYYLDTFRVADRNTGRDTGQGIALLHFNGPTSTNPSLTVTQDDNDQIAYAFFGQANFDLTDDLEISGALRYDHDKRDQLNTSPVGFAGSQGTPGLHRTASFDSLQPKATLRYRLDRDASVFASYAQGFRSGGFNQNGVRQRALALDPNATVQDDYKKELSKSWELGWKSQFMERRVTLNGAFFFTRFNNEQFFSFIPEAGAQIVTNIDRVDVKGFEVELNGRLAGGFDLVGGLGYTDAEIKEYRASPASVGRAAPYVPKLSLSAGLQYTSAITDVLDLVARLDWNRTGRQYYEPNEITSRDPLNLANARLTLVHSSDDWQVSLWSKNLFDKKYNSEYVHNGFAYRGEPRSYGIELDYRF